MAREFIGFVTRWSCDDPEPPPLVRLVHRALLRMHNAVTSGFALGLVSKVLYEEGPVVKARGVCASRACCRRAGVTGDGRGPASRRDPKGP